MFFSIPGFDPKTLSDNDLFEKQLELTRRSYVAARFGKMEMVNQLQLMIQSIESERRERMFSERIGSWMLSTSGVVVETDPDLKEKELEREEEKVVNKPKQQTTRKFKVPIRTTSPVKPDGNENG